MLLNYWEKYRLTQVDLHQELAALGITGRAQIEVIKKIVAEQGEALISSYQFRAPSGESGAIVVCHNLGRGAISFGTNTRWGRWDETYEILTLDESGERINFDGQPIDEGDDGACSLGNI